MTSDNGQTFHWRWNLAGLVACLTLILSSSSNLVMAQPAARVQSDARDDLTRRLEQDLPRLSSAFLHDFQKDGISNKTFKTTEPGAGIQLVPTPDGIQVRLSSTGARNAMEIIPRCSLDGDFDIEVGFTQFTVESRKGDTGILLVAGSDADRRPIHAISRVLTDDRQQVANSLVCLTQPDGSRIWEGDSKPFGCASGRFRLARRGDDLYYLLAEGDSKTYRLLRLDDAPPARIIREGIRLQAVCNGAGRCEVIWKYLNLRAERMIWFSDPPDPDSLFQYLDLNHNDRLSADEYAATSDNAAMHRRDFILFDADADGYLSLKEFTPIANGVDSHARGPIPDPIDGLFDEVAAALDKDLNDWDKSPDEERDSTSYYVAVSSRFSRLIPAQTVVEFDRDQNGKISRAESRDFLKVQLGVHLPGGDLLRPPNGNINNISFFIHIDANRDNQLEQAEFLSRASQGDKSEAMFAEADQDHDGILSLKEWIAQPWTYFDPIWTFRQMDTNLDRYLDTGELMNGSPEWKMSGTRRLVEAFDLNNDGKMSLAEYRLTPHANAILVWQKTQFDTDNDGRLSPEEFTVDRPWFQALRAVYFQKFDRNRDGFLDLDEYDFQTNAKPSRPKVPRQLYVLNAAEGRFSPLKTGSLQGLDVGSPAISPDGKQIAFDVRKNPYVVMVMPIEGGEPTQIVNGIQPTWSPDGQQIACTRFQPRFGSWIIDLKNDGQNFVVAGRGTQWSPDGKSLLYQTDTTLMAYDIANATSNVVLEANETDYPAFSDNASWSPDSRRICVVAKKSNGDEALLIVDVTGEVMKRAKIRHAGKRFNADSAWHPTGNRLVFAMYSDERQRVQLYECDPDTTAAPKLVKGQTEDLDVIDMTWAPNGKQLYFTAGDF